MPNLLKLPNKLDAERLTCRAIVETPKGRRSKYEYDPKSRLFECGGLLPEGMSFPLDFGFVPSTLCDDGDPIDIMILADEPAPVGALVTVRLLGVIEAEQGEDGKVERNDRLLAVSDVSLMYEKVRTVDDLGQTFLDNLSQFWVQKNALTGKRFKVLNVSPPQAAAKLIRKAERTAGK